MSFNKKFLSKSPLAYHGGPHNGQPNVKANTKAFSTMSDILPKKNITTPQQSTYGLGTSTGASWDKPKKPSDRQKAKSLEMQKKMLEMEERLVFLEDKNKQLEEEIKILKNNKSKKDDTKSLKNNKSKNITDYFGKNNIKEEL